MIRPVSGEKYIIERIEKAFQSSRSKALTVALGDDAALWRARPGYEVVLTCDWLLEGSHFLRDKHPADAVGWKCLARAVSDIAAMGGEPRCFLLNLALPASLAGKWFDGFLRGLRRASLALHCELAGGDTTRHENVLTSVTVVGEVRKGRALRRAGARAGDFIFVSGMLGEADAGLQELKKRRGLVRGESCSLRKHLYPRPRLALGAWLAERGLATAAMDLSDGLSSDLPRLCAESNLGARIDLDSLPVSQNLSGATEKQLGLHGGDDYELLFTVAKKNLGRLPRNFGGLKLTRIGEITREQQIVVAEAGRLRKLKAGGWDPFRK
jgi:thiamine-monophosphate kinase